MSDPANHPPVIDPRYASRIVGQQRLKPGKLRIAQPKHIAHHLAPAVSELESNLS
jgi:hypothetical protein